MKEAFVSTSGKLFVQTVMTKDQLVNAVRVLMHSDLAWETKWTRADAEVFEHAARVIRACLQEDA